MRSKLFFGAILAGATILHPFSASAASQLLSEMILLDHKASECDASLAEYGPSNTKCNDFQGFRKTLFPDGVSPYIAIHRQEMLEDDFLFLVFKRTMSRTIQTMEHIASALAR